MARVAAERRRHVTDAAYAYVLTELAAGHRHCVAVDRAGRGLTSPGPDGHVHLVDDLDVAASGGHTHELSGDRCAGRHAGRSCLDR